MPHYKVTPWRNDDELLQVKAELFQLDSATVAAAPATNPSIKTPGEDKRQHATNRIAAWTMRGRVPHAIQSTALLIEAQLHHATPSASAFSVRATYAAAFCRFITGYCDMTQANTPRRPMHDVARTLDMPASWVDLRHEATHGKLPSIARLEAATEGALVWLWGHYWEGLGAGVGAGLETRHRLERRTGKRLAAEEEEASAEEVVVAEVSTQQARGVLEVFLRRRVAEVKGGIGMDKATRKESATGLAGLQIIRQCRGYELNLRSVVAVMVEKKAMVPADRGPRDPMDGAFLLWTPLILTLAKYQALFLPLLLKRIISILADPAYLHPPPDVFREAIHAWILHLLRTIPPSSSVGELDGEKIRSQVVGECVLTTPNQWTGPLAKRICDEGDESFRKRWVVYLSEDWED